MIKQNDKKTKIGEKKNRLFVVCEKKFIYLFFFSQLERIRKKNKPNKICEKTNPLCWKPIFFFFSQLKE